MTNFQRKRVAGRGWQQCAIAALSAVGVVACTPIDPATETSEAPPEATVEEAPEMVDEAINHPGGITFAYTESPDGGMVQQLTLSGPQSAVLVTCDQEGLVPFEFADLGRDWVGCQTPNPGDPVGAPSAMAEVAIEEVLSPVAGKVPQVTIPGPQSALIVMCEGDFQPFLYEDQGTWIGCQS